MNKKYSSQLSQTQIKHINVLKQNVFQLKNYPSFALMIEGLEEIITQYDKKGINICLLEREHPFQILSAHQH